MSTGRIMQAVQNRNDTKLLCEDYNESIFYGKINFLAHTEHNALP